MWHAISSIGCSAACVFAACDDILPPAVRAMFRLLISGARSYSALQPDSCAGFIFQACIIQQGPQVTPHPEGLPELYHPCTSPCLSTGDPHTRNESSWSDPQRLDFEHSIGFHNSTYLQTLNSIHCDKDCQKTVLHLRIVLSVRASFS